MIDAANRPPEDQQTPRARAIATIRSWLQTGRFVSGQALPAERELAKELSVARVTVRSALAELVSEGLLDGAFRRQHRVAGLASGGLMRRTVAVLSIDGQPSGTSPRPGYDLAIQVDASRLLESSGLHVLTLNPQTLLAGGLNHLLNQRPRGVLVTYDVSESNVGQELIRTCTAAGIPVVAYGYSPDLRECDVATCDQEAGAFALGQWLIKRGRRRILRLWSVANDPVWLQQRNAGYERAMREANLPILPAIFPSRFGNIQQTRSSWEQDVRMVAGYLVEHLTGPESIDAIMVNSDPQAYVAAAALRLFGKRPNQDIDIVGYDNTWREEPSRQWESVGPLATVDKRCDHICEQLAALLLDRIDGRLPAAAQRRIVHGELIDLSKPSIQMAVGR